MRIELTTSSLPRKCSTPELQQLERSHSHLFQKTKIIFSVGSGGFEPPKSETADLQSAPFGHSGNCPSNFAIQIYNMQVLKFLISKPKICNSLKPKRASGGIRTPDQLITNQLLWPTELHWQLPKFFIEMNFPKKHTDTGHFLGRQR